MTKHRDELDEGRVRDAERAACGGRWGSRACAGSRSGAAQGWGDRRSLTYPEPVVPWEVRERFLAQGCRSLLQGGPCNTVAVHTRRRNSRLSGFACALKNGLQQHIAQEVSGCVPFFQNRPDRRNKAALICCNEDSGRTDHRHAFQTCYTPTQSLINEHGTAKILGEGNCGDFARAQSGEGIAYAHYQRSKRNENPSSPQGRKGRASLAPRKLRRIATQSANHATDWEASNDASA